jgi:CheY-like chemotaxis protein
VCRPGVTSLWAVENRIDAVAIFGKRIGPAPIPIPAPAPGRQIRRQRRPPFAQTAGQPLKSPTVLVIDDEPSILDVFARALTFGGLSPIVAQNAEAALLLIRRGLNPDAILLDLKMPGMGGLGFLLELRSDPRLATTPVAIVTGDCLLPSSIHHTAEMLNAEIHFKPLEVDAILDLIVHLIDNPASRQPTS